MQKTIVAVAATLSLAGCGADGEIFNTYDVSDNRSVSVDAQQRVINNIALPYAGQAGQIKPDRVICAEPSPDVATTISRSFALGLSAAVQTPEGVSGQGALQLSSSLAQSMAQLGERTATIQLLRDSLYRACEAYANGALSNVSYALILSRFDVLAATMMLGEVGGGAFGRKLAAIGGFAGTGGVSDEDKKLLEQASAELTNAHQNTVAQQKSLDELKAPDASADQATRDKFAKDQSDRLTKLQAAQFQESAAEARVRLAQLAQERATAAAGIIMAGGGIDRTQSKDIAEQMHQIQETYLQHASMDAAPFFATCISSLTGSNAPLNQGFQKICIDSLPAMVRSIALERAGVIEKQKETAKAISLLSASAASVCGKSTSDQDGKRCTELLNQIESLRSKL